jgi:hypothetical protein
MPLRMAGSLPHEPPTMTRAGSNQRGERRQDTADSLCQGLADPLCRGLPHWEEIPADLPAAIREIKAALRARIAASGRPVEEVFAVVERRIQVEVEEISAAKNCGETVWPVIDYANIANGTVPAEQLAPLRRRGCLVVRGHFDREQALDWDRDIIDYVESNRFFEDYRGPGDDFFGSVGSKPEIYPIYWSPAQMQARQSDQMARVQAFLNSQWTHESGGVRWFDPDRDSLYPGPHPPRTGVLGTLPEPDDADLGRQAGPLCDHPGRVVGLHRFNLSDALLAQPPERVQEAQDERVVHVLDLAARRVLADDAALVLAVGLGRPAIRAIDGLGRLGQPARRLRVRLDGTEGQAPDGIQQQRRQRGALPARFGDEVHKRVRPHRAVRVVVDGDPRGRPRLVRAPSGLVGSGMVKLAGVCQQNARSSPRSPPTLLTSSG